MDMEFQKITEPITTLKSLIRTIEHDPFTYHWSNFLITRKEVRSRLKDDARASRAYRRLDKMYSAKKGLLLALLVFVCIIIWSRVAVYFSGLIVLWVLFLWLNRMIKDCVKTVSEALFELDFDDQDFKNKTLYQICHYYGQLYHAPSLIDCICHHDRAMRRAVLFLPLFLVIIYPLALSFIETVILFVSLLYAVSAATRSQFFYRSLSNA